VNTEIQRAKLRKWLELEDIRDRIFTTASRDNIASEVYLYLSIVFNVDTTVFEVAPWYETIEYLLQALRVNTPSKKFPILTTRDNNRTQESWEYEGRTWYLWANIFAKNYGWTLEYIADLDVDEALGLMEEIMVEDQLRREWEWSLNEIAYPYNPATKKTEFKPLPRPQWMNPPISKPKVMKIPKDMLPIGVILRADSPTIESN